MNPIAITTLTPAAVQQDLQSDGLNSLGLTTLTLSPRWADATPLVGAYDPANLTLALGALHAPYRGLREFAFSPAKSTLASAITDSATTITVAAGEGARFPSPTAGNVLLTLTNASGSKSEIAACTARTGDTLTVTRAAQGTAKQSFSAGDRVVLRLSPGTRSDQFCGADGNPLTGAITVFLNPDTLKRSVSFR